MYDEADVERRAPESAGSGRGAFARDRARVLHSSALRRLAGKTQVVEPAGTHALVPRTRLTHSLECAQIGREVGAALGCDADLVDAACLAHDLGHPPFGHNGEQALDEAAAKAGGFEGNAQSFRLLTRLEPKVEGAGLNLTRATLDATLKYPWFKDERAKYGVYDDDWAAFEWVRNGRDDARRPLETQVMDFADDVAYSVHDLEDGILEGVIDLTELRDLDERVRVAERAAAAYSEVEVWALKDTLAALIDQPWWPHAHHGTSQDLAQLKGLTSTLIGRFCSAAEAATREEWGTEPLSRYDASLVVPGSVQSEIAVLKAVAAVYVMDRPEALARQEREREVVIELADRLSGAPEQLEPAYREMWEAADDDSARLRVVVDQVAALTDAAAWRMHAGIAR